MLEVEKPEKVVLGKKKIVFGFVLETLHKKKSLLSHGLEFPKVARMLRSLTVRQRLAKLLFVSDAFAISKTGNKDGMSAHCFATRI